MSYIKNNLMNGEELVYQAQLHKVIFFWPAVVVVVAMLLFATGDKYIAIVGGICLLVALVLAVKPLLAYMTSEFGVTNKRVMLKVGFIRRNSLEMLLSKVEGIQVQQGIWERILNFGSIVISGTGGTRDPFHRISAPFKFRHKVQEQIERAQEGGNNSVP